MKRILIATTNRDKFKTVSKLLEKAMFAKDEYVIESLFTIDAKIEDSKEVGQISERAKQKAIDAMEQLKNYNFEYVIGIDDGIKLKGELKANVKDYIQKMLYENYLEENEDFSFVRAYCIIKNTGEIYEAIVETPYKYKAIESATVEQFSYPLSQVSVPIGSNIPIASFSEEESFNYSWKFAKDTLELLAREIK